jgi:hypothetical protein
MPQPLLYDSSISQGSSSGRRTGVITAPRSAQQSSGCSQTWAMASGSELGMISSSLGTSNKSGKNRFGYASTQSPPLSAGCAGFAPPPTSPLTFPAISMPVALSSTAPSWPASVASTMRSASRRLEEGSASSIGIFCNFRPGHRAYKAESVFWKQRSQASDRISRTNRGFATEASTPDGRTAFQGHPPNPAAE